MSVLAKVPKKKNYDTEICNCRLRATIFLSNYFLRNCENFIYSFSAKLMNNKILLKANIIKAKFVFPQREKKLQISVSENYSSNSTLPYNFLIFYRAKQFILFLPKNDFLLPPSGKFAEFTKGLKFGLILAAEVFKESWRFTNKRLIRKDYRMIGVLSRGLRLPANGTLSFPSTRPSGIPRQGKTI